MIRGKDIYISVIWDTGTLRIVSQGVLRSSIASEAHPPCVPDVWAPSALFQTYIAGKASNAETYD